MRNRLLVVSGLIFAALALAGCPGPKPGECKTTEDCKGQQDFATDTCIEGKCVECGGDTDCKVGFVCQANKCNPKPECATAADCGTGKICKDSKCAPGCTSDAGCGTGKCVSGQCKSAGTCASSADCAGGQKCVAGTCQTAGGTTETGPCQLKRVNFGFNESTLDAGAQATLKENAECIQKRKLSVVLEGNADERGTEEYNLHLGERRAAAAKKYLQSMGVEGSKLKTISYGKERPINNGHDEAAWAENRRVDVTEK